VRARGYAEETIEESTSFLRSSLALSEEKKKQNAS